VLASTTWTSNSRRRCRSAAGSVSVSGPELPRDLVADRPCEAPSFRRRPHSDGTTVFRDGPPTFHQKGTFRMDVRAVPLAQVESAWSSVMLVVLARGQQQLGVVQQFSRLAGRELVRLFRRLNF
jgi:hypothetical protein